MKIDRDRLDEFEQQFGPVVAFDRAYDFMIDYFGRIRTPLPVVAAQALAVARKFRKNEVGLDQLVKARVNCWHYLDERSASTDFTTPEHCAIRAAICFLYEGPTQGGDAIDVVALFLNLIQGFEPPFEEAEDLLQNYFLLDQMP